MQEVTSKDLARMTAHIVNLVAYGGHRILVTRAGRPVAMLVPLEQPRPSEPANGAAKVTEP